MMQSPFSLLSLVILTLIPLMTNSFGTVPKSRSGGTPQQVTTTALSAIYTPGRSSSRSRKGGDERSKRQYRVGEFVRTELAQILHTGLIKGDATYLEQELRQRISVVSVDVSPDLKQARVSVSIRSGLQKRKKENDKNKQQ